VAIERVTDALLVEDEPAAVCCRGGRAAAGIAGPQASQEERRCTTGSKVSVTLDPAKGRA
jgi:hypothetical protein